MKAAVLASFLVASASALEVPAGFDNLRSDIVQCITSGASCHDSSNGKLIRGYGETACRAEPNYVWRPTYNDAQHFEDTVKAKEASLGPNEDAIFLVRISPDHKVHRESVARWNKAVGREFAEYINCHDGKHPFMFVFATKEIMKKAEQLEEVSPVTGKLSKVFDAAIPYPDELKQSPELREPVVGGHPTVDLVIELARGCTKNHDDAHEIASRLQRHLDSSDGVSAGHKFTAVRHDRLLWEGVQVAELDQAHAILAARPETYWVEPQVQYRLHNFDAAIRSQTGNVLPLGAAAPAQVTAGLPFYAKGITGENQVVGIGDSGLDVDSCFFKDAAAPWTPPAAGTLKNTPTHRKVTQYAAYVDGVAGQPRDHGTHVAGTVCGNSLNAAETPSNVLDLAQTPASDFNGMAPSAKIAFFDIGQPGSGAVYPPPNLGNDMFQLAYDVGARIHTNSWGGAQNAYTAGARDVDDYTFKTQDYLVTIAAGNSGKSNTGIGTLGTPASSKNCVAVGAARNTNRANDFVGADCSADIVAGSDCAESMAVFSSDGPAFDQRYGIDVVAPGQYIGSAGSATNCDVAWLQGTSMATPAVAGIAALVRQYFEDGFYPAGTKDPAKEIRPMGALVKAVLINSARPMAGNYNGAPIGASPNEINGFGEVTIGDTLMLADGAVKLYADGSVDAMPVLEQGAVKEYTFDMAQGAAADFKVTLVWHDAPAAAGAAKSLVNDIDLKVEGPAGQVYYPNNLQAADNTNNAEQIIVPAADLAAGGSFKVTVTGTTVAVGPQPYALVATGPYSGGKAPPPADGGEASDLFPPVVPGNDAATGGQNTGSGSANGGNAGGMDTTTIGLIAGGGGLVVLGGAYMLTRRGSSGPGPSAMAPAPKMGGGGLPAGWSTANDPTSGQKYYFHQATGQVSWTVPN